MKKIYIDLYDDGHHYEHALHLLNLAKEKNVNIKFCLLKKIKCFYFKSNSENRVSNNNFIDLTSKEEKAIEFAKKINNNRVKFLIYNILLINIVIKIYKKEKMSFLLINVLNNYNFSIFVLNIFLPKLVISGIYFNPLHRFKNSIEYSQNTRLRISCFFDKTRLYILSKTSSIGSIFILADKILVKYYNDKFDSKKFKFLGDPFFVNYKEDDISIRNFKKESVKKILFFGTLQTRKGLFLCLETILKIDESILSNFHFSFLGKVDNNDLYLFKEYVNKIKLAGRSRYITVENGFVDYDNLIQNINKCDIIYAGYQNYGASSGVLSWAASFIKPVLCIKNSLISENATFCGLEIDLNDYSLNSLQETMIYMANNDFIIAPNPENINLFLSLNSPKSFSESFLTN